MAFRLFTPPGSLDARRVRSPSVLPAGLRGARSVPAALARIRERCRGNEPGGEPVSAVIPRRPRTISLSRAVSMASDLASWLTLMSEAAPAPLPGGSRRGGWESEVSAYGSPSGSLQSRHFGGVPCGPYEAHAVLVVDADTVLAFKITRRASGECRVETSDLPAFRLGPAWSACVAPLARCSGTSVKTGLERASRLRGRERNESLFIGYSDKR